MLAPYLDFAGGKKIHVLKVLLWGFGGRWRSQLRLGILILIWIWSLVFDSPMILILAVSFNLKMQRTSISLSPHLELWRTLEAPD